MIRSFHHSQCALERLLEEKRETVTVVVPAREVADSVGVIVERLHSLAPLIDQVLERLSAEGRLLDGEHAVPVERPPYATLGARA